MTAVDTIAPIAPPTATPARRSRLAVLRNPWLVRLLSLGAVLVVWQVVGADYPYATSDPIAVARAFGEDFTERLLPAFRETMWTFTVGFALCVFGGVAVGLAMARLRLAQVVLEPYVTILYTTPFVAFFPVLILIFGISFDLRVAVVVIGGTMPIILNTYLGAREVSSHLLDVGTAFAARRFQVLRTIVLPGSLPYIFAGIRLGYMQAMVGAIIIELQTSAVGVGGLLRDASRLLQIDRYFATIVALGVVNLILTTLMRWAERTFTVPGARREAVPSWARAARLRARNLAYVPTTGAESVTRRRRVVARDPLRSLDRVLALRSKRLAREPRPSAVRRMLDGITATPFGRAAASLSFLVALLVSWQIYAEDIADAVLPQPTDIAEAFWRLVVTDRAIWEPTLASVHVLAVGFAIALVLGIPLGILMGRSRLAEHVLDPYVSILYALPNSVFVPVMVVWFGFGFQFRVIYVILASIFAVAINTMVGVKNISPELLATGRSFCASERSILRTIVVPGTLPFILAGVRQGFANAWVGVVVAEVLTSGVGLGGRINFYGDFFLTAEMWVPIIFIMAIAIAIMAFTNWLQPKLAPWADSAQPKA